MAHLAGDPHKHTEQPAQVQRFVISFASCHKCDGRGPRRCLERRSCPSPRSCPRLNPSFPGYQLPKFWWNVADLRFSCSGDPPSAKSPGDVSPHHLQPVPVLVSPAILGAILGALTQPRSQAAPWEHQSSSGGLKPSATTPFLAFLKIISPDIC